MFRIILFSLFTPVFLFSQNVKILDESNNPIVGASVYSTLDFYEIYDSEGNVSLDNFSEIDSLTIQQYGFEKKKIIKAIKGCRSI